MKRKGNLPESLELLLDTMCNTFGGIMFIAMSLVLISQLVTKAHVEKTPEEISKEEIAKLKEKISRLNAEVLLLKQRALEARFKLPADISPEKSAALKKFHAVAHENLQRQHQFDKDMQKSDLLNARMRVVRKQRQEAAADLNRERNSQRKEYSRLSRHRSHVEQQVADLRETLAQVKPKTFVFAMTKPTSLNSYWVIIHKNRVHRMNNESEGRMIPTGKYTLRFEPHQGTSVTGDGDGIFDRLFSEVNSNVSFINVMSDDASFETLKKLRIYARKRGFKLNWSVNNAYQFYYGKPNYSILD